VELDKIHDKVMNCTQIARKLLFHFDAAATRRNLRHKSKDKVLMLIRGSIFEDIKKEKA
jgi:hypothetical protein